MKKRNVILTVVLAGVGCMAYPRYDGSRTTGTGRAFRIPGISPIKIGQWSSHYLDGTAKEEFFWFGRRDREVTYFADGRVDSETEYRALRVRSQRQYWPDGLLKSEGHETETKGGTGWAARGYYSDGKLEWRVNYGANRDVEFEQEYFAEDGRLIGHVKDGKVLVYDIAEKQIEKLHHQPQPTQSDGPRG
jgi:hypothetical protein